jgi:hypothetical protein
MNDVVGQGRQASAANEVTIGDVLATKSKLLQGVDSLTAALNDATSDKLAQVNSQLNAALRATEGDLPAPDLSPVQSVDVVAKYSFKVLDDGFVSFTLPAGANYVELFNEANEYCKSIGRGRAAMYEGALEWFGKRADAVKKARIDQSHDIQGLVPESTFKTCDDQAALLKGKGFTLATPEAAAAAAVLYYCATGKDLFEGKWVRIETPGAELKSDDDAGLFVPEYNDDVSDDNVGAAGERPRKAA